MEKGARQEGDGYISFPTIFLSLKRLVPVAEEAKIITDDTLLTQEELNEFKQLHNKILIAQTPISSATTITSKKQAIYRCIYRTIRLESKLYGAR